MKTKKLDRKLQISKLTIANLSNQQLGKAFGGVATYDTICNMETKTACTTNNLDYCIPDKPD